MGANKIIHSEIYQLGAIVFVIALFFTCQFYETKILHCRPAKRMAKREIADEIINKYIANGNVRYLTLHGTFIVGNSKDLALTQEPDLFYQFAEIGDSLYKDKNSMDFIVKKSSGISDTFFVRYGCDKINEILQDMKEE
jgi:hypothetical protein